MLSRYFYLRALQLSSLLEYQSMLGIYESIYSSQFGVIVSIIVASKVRILKVSGDGLIKDPEGNANRVQ